MTNSLPQKKSIEISFVTPGSRGFSVFAQGFFLKCLAFFFRQENVNQMYETPHVQSYFTKQLLFISM